MKRVFAYEGKAVVREIAEPVLRYGEVLVDTAFSTISTGTETIILRKSAEDPGKDQEYPGSDPHWLKVRDGMPGRILPRPAMAEGIAMGYSAAGVIRAVGEGVTDLAPGMAVACSGSQCTHHAEVIAVPRNLVRRVPEGVSLREAAFVTLGSIATESLRKSDCRFGETVLIYGLGLLGLLAAQIAQAAGLSVIGVDINPLSLERARGLGITDVFDPTDAGTDSAIRELTGGFGVDAALVTVVTESNVPFNHAISLCRQRGVVVSVGVFGMTLDRATVVDNDITIRQAVAYGPGRYDPVYEEDGVDFAIGYVRWTENRNMGYFLKLLASGQVQVLPLAPELLPIEEAQQAYELLQQPGRPPTVQFRYQS
jgi:threonine dehydrogenase-like Zn-dependent dehydrogenase